jgi:Cupin-like domain
MGMIAGKQAHVQHIERIAAPTRAEFERCFVRRARPVIITGVVGGWKAASAWQDLGYLKAKAGTRKVAVFLSKDKDWERTNKRRDMPLHDFINIITGGETEENHYLFDGLWSLPELLEDIEAPPFLEGFETSDDSRVFGHKRLIFFGRNTFTRPHQHYGNHALLCQIVGRKRVKLFAPNQTFLLYPHSLLDWWRSPNDNAFVTRVDIDAPELDRFPEFRRARHLEFFLEAGEMLYIPSYWWHGIYSPGISLALTMTYRNRPLFAGRLSRVGARAAVASAYEQIYLFIDRHIPALTRRAVRIQDG